MAQVNSLTSLDVTQINEISLYTYQVILDIQQKDPALLNEKYRNTPWGNPRNQSAFLLRLNEELSRGQNWQTRIVRLKKFFQLILIPEFIETSEFSNILGKVPFPNTPPDTKLEINQKTKIAILLLDAENLPLDIKTEKYLSNLSTYPIQIKIAFANWKNLGAKKDIEYHDRGYELIHVPPHKDSADVKMATVGSSIFIHYPNAQEIFVCSSDRVMTHLCNTLQTHGLTVYLVRKHLESIIVCNTKTQEHNFYSLQQSLELSKQELIKQIKELIITEESQTNNPWIPLNRIIQMYSDRYQISLEQIINKCLPNKTSKDLLLESPTDFALHQIPNGEHYVMHFKKPDITEPDEELSEIITPEKLEEILVRIIERLTIEQKKPPGSYISIGVVATAFQKLYGEPITQFIKKLGITKKYRQLLESYPDFRIKQNGKDFQVCIKK